MNRFASSLKRLSGICLWVVLSYPLPVFALLHASQDGGGFSWQRLQPRVLEKLGGSCNSVARPEKSVAASSTAGSTAAELPLNRAVTANLHSMDRVSFALGPEKKQEEARRTGGLFALRPTVAGTYVIGSASHAWIDVVDHERSRFAVTKPVQWVDFCGRRMKAGVFEARAGARYWIQVSASPDPALDLFVAGPVN